MPRPFAVTRLPCRVCDTPPSTSPPTCPLPEPPEPRRLPVPGSLRPVPCEFILRSGTVLARPSSPPSPPGPQSSFFGFSPTAPGTQHAALPPQTRGASLRTLRRAPQASPKYNHRFFFFF